MISAALILVSKKIKKINVFAFAMLIVYSLSFILNYNLAVNSYNVRNDFLEYGTYLILMLALSSLYWDRRKLLYAISMGLFISLLVQSIYSLPSLFIADIRITGNTTYSNFLSLLALNAIIAALYSAAQLLRKNKYYLIIFLPVLIFELFVLFRTGSRNIIVLFPIALFLIVFFFKNKYSLILLIISILLVLILPTQSRDRLINEGKHNPYGIQRINIYKQVLDTGIRKLPFGVGAGNLKYFNLKDNFPVEGSVGRYRAVAKIAHNEYLELFANSGIFGIIMIILIAALILRYIKSEKNRDSLYKMLVVSAGVICAMGMFDNALYLPYNAVVFFTILGIISSERRQFESKVSLISIFVIILMLFSISIADIYGECSVKRINQSINNAEQIKNTDIYESINRKLLNNYFITGNPSFLEAKIIILEKMYYETSYVKYFQEMLEEYQTLFRASSMEYRYYLAYAEMLRKYKNTVLRNNPGIQDEIGRNYEISISLNPYSPFYRMKYAEYLIESGDTAEAVNQLKTAVINEPHYLKGIKKLSELTNSEDYRIRYSQLIDSLEILRKNAKVDYEKKLISNEYIGN